jgi:Pectate lyase superfamily protein
MWKPRYSLPTLVVIALGFGAIGGHVAAADFHDAKAEFGATGNGATDDTVALQACFSAAQIDHTGCHIPSGSYVISSTLAVASRITVVGDGIEGAGNMCLMVPQGGPCRNLVGADGNHSTTLLPAPTIGAIAVSTNEAVQIHDLQIIYVSPASAGSSVTAISVSGQNSGLCSGTRISNVFVAQADRLIQINNCGSWSIDHSLFFNFVTAGVVTGDNNGYNDWWISDNTFTGGPAQTSNSNFIWITASSAVNITGNKLNSVNGGVTNVGGISINPRINNSSIEPTRIVDNSIEGNLTGIMYVNSCPNQSSCTASQGVISGNQIWAGSGPDIYTYPLNNGQGGWWVAGLQITGNVLNVVGGSRSNNSYNSIIWSATDIHFSGNIFGNTSGGGANAVYQSGSNNVIVSGDNLATANETVSPNGP